MSQLHHALDPRTRVPAWAWLVLFAWAALLLSIGIDRDWRLLHEDNGALHTSFALAHLEAGLTRTRGHDLFYEPETGSSHFYAHHPSATSLVLATAFRLAGSADPAVARATVIGFQLASLALFVALLRLHFPARIALLGGAIFATLPMSSYFGRMVNYEPLCLTAVLLQLYGYARLRAHGSRLGAACLALGIVLGGLVDWPAFFFAAAIGGTEAWAAVRGDRTGGPRFAWIAALATATLAIDLAHLALAAGSLRGIFEAALSERPTAPATIASFLAAEREHGLAYLGRSALVASVLLAVALATGRGPLASVRREAAHPEVLSQWLGAAGIAAVSYLLAAPSWAIVHAYWGFYSLPFVATGLALLVVVLTERIRNDRGAWIAAALLAVVGLDVANTSFRTLRKRHTQVEEYTVQATRELRARYLAPRTGGAR